MTGNEILQSVRDELGESGNQFWKDEELKRWLYLSLNRHARKALSVEAEVKTTSLPSVQEYDLPKDFGELKNVRYSDGDLFGLVPLVYVDKQSILSAYGILDLIGTPYACYIYQHKLGLYPVPKKKAVLECKFTDTCQTFENVLDADGAYRFEFELSIEEDSSGSSSSDDYIPSAPTPGDDEADSDDADDDTPDPCRVYVSHVGVYLRRKGLPYPGNVQMIMTPPEDVGYPLYSKLLCAKDVSTRPSWHYFDFTLSPVEINETVTRWTMCITGDSDYTEANAETQGGDGVQVGVDDNSTAYFELIRDRQDIQVDYYRNSVRPITDYDVPLDVPYYPAEKTHDTLVNMVIEYALRKGQYDMRGANDYQSRNMEDMDYTRAQATLKTRGDILRVPREVRLTQSEGPYVRYENGRYLGRAW